MSFQRNLRSAVSPLHSILYCNQALKQDDDLVGYVRNRFGEKVVGVVESLLSRDVDDLTVKQQ